MKVYTCKWCYVLATRNDRPCGCCGGLIYMRKAERFNLTDYVTIAVTNYNASLRQAVNA